MRTRTLARFAPTSNWSPSSSLCKCVGVEFSDFASFSKEKRQSRKSNIAGAVPKRCEKPFQGRLTCGVLVHLSCFHEVTTRLTLMKFSRRRKLFLYAQALHKVFLAGLTAANGRRIVLDLSIGHERDVACYIQAASWKLLRTTVLSGCEAAATLIKDAGAWSRSSAFRGRGSWTNVPSLLCERILMKGSLLGTLDRRIQFSFVGRALPEGGRVTTRKALAAHKADLSRVAIVPPELCRKAEAWAERWGRRNSPTHVPLSLSLSAGACLEKSRHEGGSVARLVELSQSGPANDLPSDLRKPDDLYEVDWQSLVQQARLRVALEEDLASLPDPLPAKVTVVPTRGLKARVVTKSPAAAVALGNVLRAVCFSSLRRDRRLRTVLSGDHLKAIRECISEPVAEPCIGLSADLSVATDTLAISIAQALFRGYCKGARLQDKFLKTGLRLIGPMRVQYSDGTEFTSVRGILMGLPLSWFILNLTNLFCADSAIADVRRALSHGGVTIGRQPFRVCGDDLFSVWHPKCVATYEKNIRETGMRFSSAAKHLRSSTYGVFTEKIFSMKSVVTKDPIPGATWSRKRPVVLKPSQVSSLSDSYLTAAIAGMTLPEKTWGWEIRWDAVRRQSFKVRVSVPREDWAYDFAARGRMVPLTDVVLQPCRAITRVRLGKCYDRGPIGFSLRALSTSEGSSPEKPTEPWWVTYGPSLDALCREHPKSRRLIVSLAERLNPEVKSWVRTIGLDYNLPRCLGGFGVPTRRDPSMIRLKTVARRSARMAVGLYVLGSSFEPLTHTLLLRPWLHARPGDWREMASMDVEDLFSHSFRAVRRALGERRMRRFAGCPELKGVTPRQLETKSLISRGTEYTLMLGVDPSTTYKVSIYRVRLSLLKLYRAVPQHFKYRSKGLSTLATVLKRWEQRDSSFRLFAVPSKKEALLPVGSQPPSLEGEQEREVEFGDPIPSLVWSRRSVSRGVAPTLGWSDFAPLREARRSRPVIKKPLETELGSFFPPGWNE